MRCFPLPLLLLTVACDDVSKDDITIAQSGDSVFVDIQHTSNKYIMTCSTPVIQLAQMAEDGSTTPLETDVEAVGDRYTGYWLDGEFVYPSLDEGCDVLMCVPIEENPTQILISYEVTGEAAPPDDLDTWLKENGGWMEAEEMVTVVESAPILDRVEVMFSYYEDAECMGDLQTHVDDFLVD